MSAGYDPAFRLRSILWSAFRAGGLLAFGLHGAKVPNGFELSVVFRSHSAACRFARRWAVRLASPVTVRPFVRLTETSATWHVSLPVDIGQSRMPGSGCMRFVSGGLRGFIQDVFYSGLGVF